MTVQVGIDSSKTRKSLSIGGKSIDYYSIPAATAAGLGDFSKLPAALKVVLENMLRFEDNGRTVSVDDIKAFSDWALKVVKIHVKSHTVQQECLCRILQVFQL
jgi:aconitate hydratase